MKDTVGTGASERCLQWHLPTGLREALPEGLRVGLQRIRMWAMSRHLPRRAVFEQSVEDAGASKSMSIIVPIHDAHAATRRCLASLEKYAPEAEVTLVDDASQLPETRATIHEFEERNAWRVVRHNHPLGHSRACEAGALLATRPCLCLLNSDTVVTPWCWRIMKDAFEADPRIGVAGPSTSWSGVRQQTISFAHYCRHYWNDSQVHSFARTLLTDHQQAEIVDVPWASGCALFIRRSLWADLGGFDTNLPDYGNEVDLCKRASGRGYRAVCVRKAYIHHLGQRSYDERIGKQAIRARIVAAADYSNKKHPA
jgi:GT2 family glycosyltransferase